MHRNWIMQRYIPGFLKVSDVGSAGNDISANKVVSMRSWTSIKKENMQNKVVDIMREKDNKSYSLIDQLPGAQKVSEETEEDEGHGAAMLSLKSHVKLKPVELSNIPSAGKFRSKHPAFEQK